MVQLINSRAFSIAAKSRATDFFRVSRMDVCITRHNQAICLQIHQRRLVTALATPRPDRP